MLLTGFPAQLAGGKKEELEVVLLRTSYGHACLKKVVE